MIGEIPVKAVTAERGEKNKSDIGKIIRAFKQEMKGLVNHQDGAAGNKQVAVNEKRGDGTNDPQNMFKV